MIVVQKVLSITQREEPQLNIFAVATHIPTSYKIRITNLDFSSFIRSGSVLLQ